MAGKDESSDSDGPIIDDNIIRIQLRKPSQRKWELRTRNHSPGIRFPTVQLFDCDGNLLVETNDENVSIKSSDFDDPLLKTSHSLKERDFRHILARKPVKKHNTISGDKVYTRVYRTPLATKDNAKNINDSYIIRDSNSVSNIPSKLTLNNFTNLQTNSLATSPFHSEGLSEISSYKSSDNETSNDINQTITTTDKENLETHSVNLIDTQNSPFSSISSLNEIDQVNDQFSSNNENEPDLALHKSRSFNDATMSEYKKRFENDILPRSKSSVVYNPPHNKISFLNTYLKSLQARVNSNPDWFALHRRRTIEYAPNSHEEAKRQEFSKISSGKPPTCKTEDMTSDNEFINIGPDDAVHSEMRKRLKMYRRGISEIAPKHRNTSIFTKTRRHSVSGTFKLVHTSSSESVDEADVVLNRLKRRILRNKFREKRRSLGAKFQFSECLLYSCYLFLTKHEAVLHNVKRL